MKTFAAVSSLAVLLGATTSFLASATLLAQGVGVRGKPKGVEQRARTPSPLDGAAASVYSKTRLPAAIESDGGIEMFALPMTGEAPFFSVMVDPSLTLVEPEATQYLMLASHLSGLTDVPTSRTSYYSALIASPEYTILGWLGFLTSVQPTTGGSIITVDVAPAFVVPTAIDSDYRETYFIATDGTIQFVSWSDPRGLAGRMPPEIKEY